MVSEIMGINRLRMGTDGEGISTLVTFYGCHLNCKYCLNPQCKDEDTRRTNITPEHLVDILSVDDIYFRTTGGGVVFGGGEPLLQADYIKEVCKRIPEGWQKRIETSLNVSWDKIKLLIPYSRIYPTRALKQSVILCCFIVLFVINPPKVRPPCDIAVDPSMLNGSKAINLPSW